MHGHDLRRLLLLCGLIGLAACTEKDWRAAAIAKAEDEVRDQVNDPVAQFSHVQVTGNSSTGQTCGYVMAKSGIFIKGGHFIVYIDGSTPRIEGGMGRQSWSKQEFDFQWQNDCLKEGYKS
ncbi:hypothetical protein [Mesorhizobium amorphae]|uniref:Lipoprotein n=1 Tax=Mesorhizobium amorphae CCNWGS0123 TaxID=1082933 RepID=G6Y878_9HYPH|nr:hypothetical protein [Mesorhizobium amorphae]ANT51205.1 hypothetical protein A6B35_15415 [Mesorhizobium amorphae CCNWGS0123]EHH12045.1 hypothetical protein MEA186_10726 [Mesorhizobium amorphae CCNWGS0123]GLR42588.1 hypothetical protein GCM10007880_31040 [Mesorhizobium amorphae]